MKAIWLNVRDRIWVVVDDIDYEWAILHVWNAKPRTSFLGDHWYAKRNVGPARTPIYLHREITRRAYGEPPEGKPISDHRSGNTLDCRRPNLRWVSYRENARNIGGRSFTIDVPDVVSDIPF